jgi:predicted DNA-binding transcriptional regulator AlpA
MSLDTSVERFPDLPTRLIGLSEMARLCAVSESTVRAWERRGEIPKAIRLGKRLRWRPDQVRELIGLSAEAAAI